MKHIINILKDAANSIKNQRVIKLQVLCLWAMTIMYYMIRMFIPLLQSALLDGAVSLFDDIPKYSLLIIGLLGILFSEALLSLNNAKWGILYTSASNEINIGIQSKIYNKLCTIPYGCFNSPEIYEKIQIVSGKYAGYCSSFLAGRTLSSLIGTLISFIFTTSVLISIDPIIALVVVCGNFFGLFKTWLEAHLNYYSAVEKMKDRRYADTYRSTLFDRNTIKEIKVLGLTDYIYRKWYKFTSRVNRKTIGYNISFLLLDFLTYLIANVFTVAALLLTARMILNGEIGIGSFLLVYSSSGSLIDTSGNLFGAFRDLKLSTYYNSLYNEIMSMPDIELNEESMTHNDHTKDSLDIIFENVNYTYDGSATKAIDNLNLVIRQGEKIAIVGENGCGKTTLVSLLNGLYIPDSGNIYVSGISHTEQLALIRRHISTVFQKFGKYETNFRENIVISDINHSYSDEEIMECAHKTGIDKKIYDYVAGLDTPIGRFEKGGINLSGGEWQKLAVTRGLFGKDKKILIMDEPNAALDPVAEADMYKNILDTVGTNKDQTLILITHRLGAIKYVDRIVVMDHGRIVEDGSHESLMQKGGKYYEMYNSQAKWYES